MGTSQDEQRIWPPFSSAADRDVIEQTELSHWNPPLTTWELLQETRARFGSRVMVSVVHPDDPLRSIDLTGDEFVGQVVKIANSLRALGVDRTDPVALISPNTTQVFAATLAAELAGIAAPINPVLAVDHAAGLLAASGARVLIAAGPELDAGTWALASDLAGRGQVEHLLVLRPDGAASDAPALGAIGSITPRYLDDLIESQPSDRFAGPEPQPDDIASLFHTGGTTGVPKMAVHLHRNEGIMAWEIATLFDLGDDATMFAALPLFHVNALIVTGLGPLLRGIRSLWAGPLGYRDPAVMGRFWQLIEHYSIAAMSAVPTVYHALCSLPVDADLSSLRFPAVGAAPLPVAVRDAWRDHTGVELSEGYGLTEGTCASAVTPPDQTRPGAVGTRLPYQQLKSVTPDGTPGSADQPGAILISGPTVFPGYLTRDGDALTIDDRGTIIDGWLDSGDLGWVDDDGYLYLTGREKDLIIRGGHNIDPASIEDMLRTHPDIVDAAAVGQPHPHSGEVPVAYVVMRAGAVFDPVALSEFAAANIHERAANPVAIYQIDAIPVTAVGKPFKPALRADAAERAESDSHT